MELGLLYWNKGRKKEANEIFVRLGRRSIEDFDVQLKVVQNYLEPNRHKEAVVISTGMLKGAPQSSDIHHLAGLASNATTGVGGPGPAGDAGRCRSPFGARCC